MARDFPPLSAPSVFIAAPGDLDYLREAAVREFEALVGEVADDHGLQVYNWVYDKAEEGFRDWLPAQQQIPLPSDPLCRAVICLLGERIGTPLSSDFDTAPLGPLEEIAAGGFRLVHPWEPAAAERGGFALSGTVFECLVALRANRDSAVAAVDDRGEGGDRPLLLLLVGDESIAEETDPLLGNWGMRRLKRRVDAHLEQKEGRRALSAQNNWFNGNYVPQLVQLSNFARYLQARRGFFPHVVADEEAARAKVRTFLRGALDLRIRDETRYPFKGLEPYERDDWGVFFGRKTELRRAVLKLGRLWKDTRAPTFFGVIGGSGAGKSSFARAGLVAHLCHWTSEGRYVACVVRPTDLLGAPLGVDPGDRGGAPLLAVFLQALAQVDAGADLAAARRELRRTIEDERPALVLQRLAEALARRGEGWRLLLTFDQFEELLDQQATSEGRPLWAPVVELILLAVEHPAVGVIYTLQTNREELIAQHPVLGSLWANGDRESLVFPTLGLDEIIGQPFQFAAGIELERELANELLKRITKFADSAASDSQGSLLPLVSLTLKRIWDACGAQVLARDSAVGPAASGVGDEFDRASAASGQSPTRQEVAGASAHDAGRAAGPGRMLRLDDCAHLLDIEGAIAQLGEEAVAEARANAGASWDDDAIGELLRRLVRLAGGSSDRLLLPLAVLPKQGPVRRLAEALMRRRLVLWEPGDRVRLVHEAVVRYWTPATKWLAAERHRLHLVSILSHRAQAWDDWARPAIAPARVSETDVDEAAEVLAHWFGVLSDGDVSGKRSDGASGEADTQLLRDYALALLLARPTPMRTVESSSRKSRHVHLASGYGAMALLDRYLALEPDCVLVQRSDQRTPLFDPCFTGRLDVVDKLLANGAAAAQADVDAWQPIHAAASSGHTAIVERLVAAGVSPAARGGPWQSTPLHLAVASGHAELSARLLASAECDPAVTTRSGWTPLHLAAQEGHDAIVRALVATGRASIDAATDNDWTALHVAANHGHESTVRTLLELGARQDARAKNDWATEEERNKRPAERRWQNLDWTPLHVAVAAGHEAVVRSLREGGADPDAANDASHTPLMLAIAAGKEGLVRALLAAGRPHDLERRDARGRTALQQTLVDDRFELARLLIEAGADVNAVTDDRSVLTAAVVAGNEARVAFLLQQGADPHVALSDGRTPLHLACAAGNLPLVRRLVGARADPNRPDAAGRTPLHRAAASGAATAADVVAWIVQQPGVDVAQGDRDGMAALHVAIAKGCDAAATALIAHGQALDARDADGWTPLLLAAHAGRVDIVRGLLAAGRAAVNVDAVADRPALSPLQAAAEGGHLDVIELLVQAGADMARHSADKPAALELAVRNAQFDAANRLLDRGAVPADADALLANVLAFCRRKAVSGLPVPEAADTLATRLRAGGAAAADVTDDVLHVENAARSLAGFTRSLRLARSLQVQVNPEVDANAEGGVGRPLSVHDAAIVRGIAHYPFEALPHELIAPLLDAIHPVDGKWQVDAAHTRCEQVRLPWYRDVVLLRVTDGRWRRTGLALYYLGMPAAEPHRALYRLNGTSPPIHEVNRIVPLSLDAATALGYLKFFCFFVRGEEGPFYLFESLDDPLVPRDVGGEVHNLLGNAASPTSFDGHEDDGGYRYSAVVWYSTALFAANFKVHPTGMVEMLGDDPIAGNLPGSIDAPIA